MDRDIGNAIDDSPTTWITSTVSQSDESRQPEAVERSLSIFSENLDRLMTLRGMRNSVLAREVGVSRETVAVWRRGRSLPNQDRSPLLASVLEVSEAELFNEHHSDTPPMLPIAQWAKREGIPVGRAKSLFELGILTGSVGLGKSVHLVPVALRAPANSKHLVRVARRPSWVANFAVNLDGLMRELNINNADMAAATDVGQCAVTHWRSGRGYPLTVRLPKIAATLECEVNDLLSEPLQRRMSNWRYRYGHAWHNPGERIDRGDIPDDDEETEDVPIESETV